MIVWVLMISVYADAYHGWSVSAYHIDNIASAESCEQLARVVRQRKAADGFVVATCAPVRKVK